MKVQNVSVFIGEGFAGERSTDAAERRTENKSIYAGEWNKQFDPIEQKKQQAKKQAMRVVGKARQADQKIEQDMQKRRDKIEDYKKELKFASDELNRFEEEEEALRKGYGVEEDSKEQQELELLKKSMDSKRGGRQLTGEEKQQLGELDETRLTEYQQRAVAMYKERFYYEDMRKAAQDGISEETRIIAATRQAMLKSQGMIKAEKKADKIMQNAGEEIIGMLLDEAKEHIDEEMEEKIEAAEEKAEKEKEEKERLEEIKEEKKENEEFAQQLAETTEYMVDLEGVSDNITKEIKKIAEEMKLLEEDLKGAAVDTQI